MLGFKLFLEGSENIWFHGSPNYFTDFRIGKYSPDEQLGFGIHFSKNKDFAELYGKYLYTANLFPVRLLDTTKIYNINDPEYQFVKELYKKQRRFQLPLQDNQFVINLDIVHPKKAYELLKSHGYDAVLYDAKYGSSEIGGMRVSNKSLSMTILDPSKIKIINVEKP